MPRKPARSVAPSGSNRRARAVDPDDAPEITDAMLAHAEIVREGRVVRPGRPWLGDAPKLPVTIRLDADVVGAYRARGKGWQSTMNADLRRVLKLKKPGAA